MTTTAVDVADQAAAQAWSKVVEAHGRVNLIVNNAGVAMAGTVQDTPIEHSEWMIGINFWGGQMCSPTSTATSRSSRRRRAQRVCGASSRSTPPLSGRVSEGRTLPADGHFKPLTGLAVGSPRDFFDLPARASRRFFQSGVPSFEYPRSDLPDNVRFVGALLPHRRATAELRRRFPADNLLVEDYLDFDLLLPHARLFVCNGGYGSIMLAFANGLPVLSAGKREGKNDVNARIDHFGLGIDLRTEQPTAKRIARGVDRILSDEGYAQRVARLRAELQTYDPLDIIAHEIAAPVG